MFSERIFSIGISQFKLKGIDNEFLCERIRYYCTNPDSRQYGHRDMGTNNPILEVLNKTVLEQSSKIIDGIVANPDIKIFPTIKRVWGNHNLNSDICIPHRHRDSFLSAVYYPKNTDGVIHFHSPWSDAINAHIPIGVSKQYHEFNSSYYEITPETGTLLLFPANLLHFVLPTPGERYSIVYDIGVTDGRI